MCPWPAWLHGMQYELLSQREVHIQPDGNKMTDTHADVQTHSQARTAATVRSHSKSQLHLWSHQADALDWKPGHTATPRWLRALPTAGSFPAPPCLIHARPSALIAHRPCSPGNMQILMYTYSTVCAITSARTHTHSLTQTNQGHQAKWNLICRHKLIRFASIGCVLSIC